MGADIKNKHQIYVGALPLGTEKNSHNYYWARMNGSQFPTKLTSLPLGSTYLDIYEINPSIHHIWDYIVGAWNVKRPFEMENVGQQERSIILL